MYVLYIQPGLWSQSVLSLVTPTSTPALSHVSTFLINVFFLIISENNSGFEFKLIKLN